MNNENKHISRRIGVWGIIIPVIIGTLILVYYTIPSVSNAIDIHVLKRDGWYYGGEINIVQKRWVDYPQKQDGKIKNFQFLHWWKAKDITEEVIKSAVGYIISHVGNVPTWGHSFPSDAPPETKFSDPSNLTRQANNGDCFYVKRIVVKPGKTHLVSRRIIWIYATKLTCDWK